MRERGPCADHDCMDHRQRVWSGDVMIERCNVCRRVRHETDGVRPMAWVLDFDNGTGNRYAYLPSRNDPDKPTIWRFPTPPRAGEPEVNRGE